MRVLVNFLSVKVKYLKNLHVISLQCFLVFQSLLHFPYHFLIVFYTLAHLFNHVLFFLQLIHEFANIIILLRIRAILVFFHPNLIWNSLTKIFPFFLFWVFTCYIFILCLFPCRALIVLHSRTFLIFMLFLIRLWF